MTASVEIVTGAEVQVTESATVTVESEQTGTSVQLSQVAVTLTMASGQPGIGLPGGGATGQILVKKSGAAYDTEWAEPPMAGVTSVNTRTGAVTLGVTDLKNVSANKLIGRSGGLGGAGNANEIALGDGMKLSGDTLLVDPDYIVPVTAQVVAGTGLSGGGAVKESPQVAVDFAASGVSSATKAVRADDARIAPWTDTTPTLAANLAGIPQGTVIPAGETAVSILQRILYPYQSVAFSGFSVSGVASVYEIGQPFITSGTASWSVSGPSANWTAASGAIAFLQPNGSESTIDSGFSPTALTRSLSVPAITAPTNPRSANSIRLRLSGSQAQGSVAPADITRQWFSRWYFGKSTNSNLLTPSFDIAGTNSGNLLQTTSAQGPTNQTISVPAGSGFFYLFIHDGYTLNADPPFYGLKYGGNALATDQIVTVTVTNAYGVTATYKRYKSTFSLGDLLSIVVNPTS
jgi:hypothetical protein